jgi:hypothetical protein
VVEGPHPPSCEHCQWHPPNPGRIDRASHSSRNHGACTREPGGIYMTKNFFLVVHKRAWKPSRDREVCSSSSYSCVCLQDSQSHRPESRSSPDLPLGSSCNQCILQIPLFHTLHLIALINLHYDRIQAVTRCRRGDRNSCASFESNLLVHVILLDHFHRSHRGCPEPGVLLIGWYSLVEQPVNDLKHKC